MKSQVMTIGEAFSGTRRYVAPNFQRAFSWSAEEATVLLADLRDAVARAAAGEPGCETYFLGAIVLCGAESDRTFELIDGQQRWTTLAILLATARDLDADDALHARIMAQSGGLGAAATGLVTPRRRDTAWLLSCIQREGATRGLSEDTPVETDSQAHMLSIALSFRAALEELSSDERAELMSFLLSSCLVVAVFAPDDEQASRIYQVLNARGARLTDIDLLKSEILTAIAPHRRDRFVGVWEDAEGLLGEDDFARLFAHLRMIRAPGRSRRAALAEVREIFRPAEDPERFLVQDVEPNAALFRRLLDARLPLGGHSAAANQHLRSLNRLGPQDWAAPAMAYLSRPDVGPAAATEFLRALERVAYALLLQSADVNARNARYARIVKAINAGDDAEALHARLDLSKHEKGIARTVLSKNFYQKDRARLPVLLRIDEKIADRGATYEIGEATVEHVLPQNPPEQSPWRTTWPDSVQRRLWTDRIGNLALLSRKKNQDAGNLPFDRKKREYFARGGVTPFALTTQVLIEPDWTPAVVAQRQETLVQTAIDIWDF